MNAPWVRKGRPVLAFWVKVPAPEIVEVMAASGGELVVLDMEHGAYDRRTMALMVGFARGLGLSVFVRVLGHTRAELQPPLDAGADGLLVPHVDDVETARRVVDVCRFPPLGSRSGAVATRAGHWGRSTTAEYVSRGNTEVTIVAQIESPAAVAAVDEIATVPGLDAVFLGPFDLALASGISSNDPQFAAMVARVEQVADRVAIGGLASTAAQARDMMARGYSFVLAGADTSLLGGAVASLVSQVPEVAAAAVGAGL